MSGLPFVIRGPATKSWPDPEISAQRQREWSEKDRDWLLQQALIEADSADRYRGELGRACSASAWARECAIVSLRWLARSGKLKPTTDDERAALEWVQREPRFDVPAANRRLAPVLTAAGPPSRDEYAESVRQIGQAVLFGNDEETA